MSKKAKKKASYEGYMLILIEESTLRTAYGMMEEGFNLWDWIDRQNSKGYEFQFERENETDFSMCVMKQMNPQADDAGIYLFTTAQNPLEAIVLTWYKFEILNQGKALKKTEQEVRSPYR